MRTQAAANIYQVLPNNLHHVRQRSSQRYGEMDCLILNHYPNIRMIAKIYDHLNIQIYSSKLAVAVGKHPNIRMINRPMSKTICAV